MNYNVVIIGGGIVGLATAYHLAQQFPTKSIVVLEKETDIATHQTGRNSGVIHSGIYYKPGSLKAKNCREGKRTLIAFCEKEGVAFNMCGKVIVAVTEDERPRLKAIYERGQENQVACELIGKDRLHELEPHTSGLEAVYVPEAGIVDYVAVSRRLSENVKAKGNEVVLSAEVRGIHSRADRVTLDTAAGEFTADYVINCAGLYSDHVARLSGQDPEVRIIPFRGEYYELKPHARHLCHALIYPVPDPAFPFLGVHFTLMIDGSVECGPNAVFAFAREGYTFGKVNIRELLETLTYPGFLRLAGKHWKMGAFETWRSLSKRSFLKSLRRLIPEINKEDLDVSPAGVRAQAIARDGDIVDDFLIKESERVINVCNAPSPAATACLNIGSHIVGRLASRFS